MTLPAWLDALARRIAPERGPRVVFLGDSITQMWTAGDPRMFRRNRINAGVPGETTREMQARFDRDVIAAKPAIVHIMGGTNDLWHGDPGRGAGHTFDNIAAMLASARKAGIAVVLASPPPIAPMAQTLLRHPELLKPMMAGIRRTAEAAGVIHVDYANSLADARGVIRDDFTTDGIHLSHRGYRAIRLQANQTLHRAAPGPAL